jgi:hypothetical protein
MLPRSILALGAGALMALGAVIAPSSGLAAALAAGSSASAVSATFTVNTTAGSLAPQAVASGVGSAAYNKTVSVPSLTKRQAISLLTLVATAKTIKDTASSTGAKGGVIASTASASIDTITGKITTPLGTALTATATKLVSSAGLTKSAAKNTPSSAVSIGSLSINSSVFGVKKSYKGKPKPNFVLYQNKDKTVTVYLNRQITTTKAGKVVKVSVSAVNLHVAKYVYAGQTLSGDLFLATSAAN